MQRRRFIKTSCLCAVGCLTGTANLFTACGTVAYYAKCQVAGNRISVPKSEFTYVAKNGESRDRNFVLVKPAGVQFPIALSRTGTGYAACLLRCTHQGCEVEVQGSRYACPCHGSEFDRYGAVLQGPAEQPLYRFKTEEDDQYLHILLA